MRIFTVKKLVGMGFLALMVLLAGCVPQGDTFNWNGDVGRMMATDHYLQDYNYYYDGSKMLPRAVIGVKKGYHLQSKIWQPINLTESQLRDWQLQVLAGTNPANAVPEGAELRAADGTLVAVWLGYNSDYTWSKTDISGDKTVIIYPPLRQTERTRIFKVGNHI